MELTEIKQQYDKHISKTYARNNVCIVKGKNAVCYDNNGKEYIDFTSGIGVNSVGYGNEKWVSAVSGQAGDLAHISNLYYTIPPMELAEKLCGRTGYSNVFFCNSGAEANEGAIKAARKYSYDKYGKGRSKIITLINSFHGRTMAAITATGQEHFHDFFFPFVEGFEYVPAGDLEQLKLKADKTTCAIMIELIQGEGGVIPLDVQYVNFVRKLCDDNDILLIIDEVQTGIGRTGKMLCAANYGVKADIITVAKGLGGGLPIGAVLFADKCKDVFGYGHHGTTFGANPIVCAGANAVMDVLDDKTLDEVVKKGEYIKDKLSGVEEVESVTGMGLMIGIKLKTKQAKDVLPVCTENGLLILTAKDKLRMLPPLTVSYEEIDRGLDILSKILNEK